MKEFWDERYAEKEFAYGSNPNEFLVEKLISLQPGRILLPADGEGRNSVFAAEKGWDVYAFDYSKEGKRKAEFLAKEKNVQIHFDVLDASDFVSQKEEFDVIGLFYAHFPVELRKKFHREAIKSLKKGGLVILEAFHPLQLNHTSGGPKLEDMLLTVEQLKQEFDGLKFLELEDKEISLSEGRYHVGNGDRKSVV